MQNNKKCEIMLIVFVNAFAKLYNSVMDKKS